MFGFLSEPFTLVSSSVHNNPLFFSFKYNPLSLHHPAMLDTSVPNISVLTMLGVSPVEEQSSQLSPSLFAFEFMPCSYFSIGDC